MQIKPVFLGACVLASIAGAIGGATINTRPIQRAGVGAQMPPAAAIAFDPSDSGLPVYALPEHYPMTTPEGRIEVAELSTRGLFSQERFGWRDASYAPPPSHAWPEPRGEWSIEPAAGSAPGEPPAPLSERPPSPPPVTPRVIDVAAEVAAL